MKSNKHLLALGGVIVALSHIVQPNITFNGYASVVGGARTKRGEISLSDTANRVEDTSDLSFKHESYRFC